MPAYRTDIPLDFIRLSDPSILADAQTHTYYLTGTGGLLWQSKDLRRWASPRRVAQPDPTSWMGPNPMIWAAELHPYHGKYCFATFTSRAVRIDTIRGTPLERRATHVLVAAVPYWPFGDATYLPANKSTLDGIFWVDNDQRSYLVYYHEWVQNRNGTVKKIELKPDLSGTLGAGQVLFLAGDSPWSRENPRSGFVQPNKVTHFGPDRLAAPAGFYLPVHHARTVPGQRGGPAGIPGPASRPRNPSRSWSGGTLLRCRGPFYASYALHPGLVPVG